MHDRQLTASGSQQRRPQPIPARVKDALRLMVYGRLNDPDCQALDFIAAAKECGIAPDQMRRYLDRPNVRALLMQERKAFRLAICASNESALLDIRNNAANSMARIASIRALEQLTESETRHPVAEGVPAFQIIIQAAPASEPQTIDITPARPRPIG
jgi:hypothetical protein